VAGQNVKKHCCKRSQTTLLDNRVLWRKTGRRSEEARGERRVLRNEELHLSAGRLILQTVDHSRQMKQAGQVARTGNMKQAQKILAEKLEVKRQRRRPTRTWKDNIKVGTESGMKACTRFSVVRPSRARQEGFCST